MFHCDSFAWHKFSTLQAYVRSEKGTSDKQIFLVNNTFVTVKQWLKKP